MAIGGTVGWTWQLRSTEREEREEQSERLPDFCLGCLHGAALMRPTETADRAAPALTPQSLAEGAGGSFPVSRGCPP